MHFLWFKMGLTKRHPSAQTEYTRTRSLFLRLVLYRATPGLFGLICPELHPDWRSRRDAEDDAGRCPTGRGAGAPSPPNELRPERQMLFIDDVPKEHRHWCCVQCQHLIGTSSCRAQWNIVNAPPVRLMRCVHALYLIQ